MPRRSNKIDASKMEVQKVPCNTCPFAGKNPVKVDMNFYMNELVKFNSSHLCHSADNKKICRGGRDIQLRLMVVMGILKEATDECFRETSIKYIGK